MSPRRWFLAGAVVVGLGGGCGSASDPAEGSGGAGETGGSEGDGDGDMGGDGGAVIADPCEACSGATPECNDDDECVACTEDNHCEGDTPVCADEACVECAENSACSSANASKCSANECGGCEEDSDCSHIDDLNVCDIDASACVQCNDSSDCGGNPCNPLTHECSEFGTTRLTCETCDTDENCAETDNFCVPMQYGGMDRPGGYCLKTAPGCTEPYTSLAASRESLSGESGQNYCRINETLATCEAVRALLDNTECPGGNDSECPESGVCKDIGRTLTNRCTYECDGVTDCKESGAGSTCGTTEPNDFCGYVPG